MAVNEWWSGDDAEIFFMETTDRSDIGVDLRAPQSDDAGHVHHAYALVPHVRSGDVIFHYQQPRGIVAWSRAAGAPFEDDLVWGARGRAAQKAGVRPYRRAGWRVPLEGPFMLPEPVSLGRLRDLEPEIRRSLEELEREVPGTIYRPFQLSSKQPLRATQHYLTKMPLAVLLQIPQLVAVADEARSHDALAGRPSSTKATGAARPGLGQPYVAADEEAATTERDPFEIDPSVVDRGVRGHAATQNSLASVLLARGFTPRSPAADEPQYDLGWKDDHQLFVAEVKSLTLKNEERQLRLGLGQLLRYRHILELSTGLETQAVLAVEREPSDSGWIALCAALDVRLCWPPDFVGL